MNDVKDVIVKENVSLKNYNTYKVESKAKYLISVNNIDALINILRVLKEQNIEYFILGAGSNVILDDYFLGAIIKLDGLNYIEINDLEVLVGAGTMMGTLTKKTVNNNLTGLEWAINIPGTVGGSINNNAGAYNSEIFDNLISLKVLTKDFEVKEVSKTDLEISYRTSNIKIGRAHV